MTESNQDAGAKMFPKEWILTATPMELSIAKTLGKRMDVPGIEAYEYKGHIYVMDCTK